MTAPLQSQTLVTVAAAARHGGTLCGPFRLRVGSSFAGSLFSHLSFPISVLKCPVSFFIGKINGFRVDFREDVISKTPKGWMRVIELHSFIVNSRSLIPADKDRKWPRLLAFIEPHMELLR